MLGVIEVQSADTERERTVQTSLPNTKVKMDIALAHAQTHMDTHPAQSTMSCGTLRPSGNMPMRATEGWGPIGVAVVAGVVVANGRLQLDRLADL